MLGITGAGISMVTKTGNRGVVCATDDVSARIEDLQFTLGEGPCVDAAEFGAPVMVPDLRTPEDIVVDRWPAFIEGAEAAGVRAVFAFPLRIGAINLGVLDVYRSEPGPLYDGQLRAALLAADAAALARCTSTPRATSSSPTTPTPVRATSFKCIRPPASCKCSLVSQRRKRF